MIQCAKARNDSFFFFFFTVLQDESDKAAAAAALRSHSLLRSFSLPLQTGRRHANVINSRVELSQLSDGLVRPSPPGGRKDDWPGVKATKEYRLEGEPPTKTLCVCGWGGCSGYMKINRQLRLV